MRFWVFGVAVLLSPVAGEANPPIEIVHTAPLSCTAVCPHWDAPDLMGYSPCSNPFPQGSFDQSIFRFSGLGTERSVDIEARYDLDWQVFICSATDPPREVGRLRTLAKNCGTGVEPVDWFTSLPVGCVDEATLTERVVLLNTDGTTSDFIVRSYSWLAASPVHISLDGDVELVDDSYEASLPSP